MASIGMVPTGALFVLVALGRHVAAAGLDRQLDVQLALFRQGGDVLLGIEDLDVGAGLDVAGRDDALALRLDARRFLRCRRAA